MQQHDKSADIPSRPRPDAPKLVCICMYAYTACTSRHCALRSKASTLGKLPKQNFSCTMIVRLSWSMKRKGTRISVCVMKCLTNVMQSHPILLWLKNHSMHFPIAPSAPHFGGRVRDCHKEYDARKAHIQGDALACVVIRNSILLMPP